MFWRCYELFGNVLKCLEITQQNSQLAFKEHGARSQDIFINAYSGLFHRPQRTGHSLFRIISPAPANWAFIVPDYFTGPSKLGFHSGPAMVRTSSGVPMTSASVASYRFGTCFVLETLHVVQARLPDQDNRLLVVCIASRPQGALRRPFPSIIEPN